MHSEIHVCDIQYITMKVIRVIQRDVCLQGSKCCQPKCTQTSISKPPQCKDISHWD
jgi:hypothetical protein